MISLLTFVSDIDDIKKIAFDKNISSKTRDVFKDCLLTHNRCDTLCIKRVLLCVEDTSAHIRNRAFTLLIEDRDKRKLQTIFRDVISQLGKDDYISQRCEKFLESEVVSN